MMDGDDLKRLPLCLLFAMPLLVLPTLASAQPVNIPALEMTQGQEGWSGWSGTTAHEWAIAPAEGHGGKPALVIKARDRSNEVMAMTATDKLQAGRRYAVSIWWQLQDLNPDAQVDFRTIFRDKDEKWLTGNDQRAVSSEEREGWLLRRYRVTVPAGTASTTLGIWVRETAGTIRASDFRIEELPPQQRTFDSMYDYDPEQVPLGMAPLLGFRKLKAEQSLFLARARRWNELLVQAAFAQEDLSRARRALSYAGHEPARLEPLEKALAQVLDDLDKLQQRYGRLHDAKQPGELATQFDPEADKLAADLNKTAGDLQRFLGSLCPNQPLAWAKLAQPERDLPWWDADRRRPRYMLWSRWSDADFWEMEQPLNMGDGHTLTSGAPARFENGVADWSNYLKEWETKQGAGAARSSLITHYSLHDKGYLAPEFAKQHDDDPDLRMWDLEGKPLGAPAGVTMLNWLNPLAREHMVDVLSQMARFFQERREFQYYITSWESAGPYAGSVRIGQNPSHAPAFREYLKQRYGAIEDLNRRWGANYGSFEELAPAPEHRPAAGEAATALEIESQRWAHEAYVDYLSLITRTLRAIDPQKPVLGEQSGIPARVFSPRLMDSVDLIGHHNRAGTTMPVQLWISSLQRYHKTPSALFENFWGCQEDHPQRLSDERAMRAQMRRYLYRHAVWGRCAQVWWYAYTSAPYLLSYNGNWFNPIYDLTTFRYSAPGFPVERAKVDRVERVLLESEIVPSRILLVQPYMSMLAQGKSNETVREWLSWHGILYPRNLLYEIVPDEYFSAGRASLKDFDVVILPFATHLNETFTKQLIEFARAGGTVICSGPAGLYDELGRPNGALLAATAPVLQPEKLGATTDWRYGYGQGDAAGYVQTALGKGRLIALTSPAPARGEVADQLARLVRKHAVPAAEAPGTTLELLLRRLPDGRHLLCALNRDPDKATAGEIIVNGAFSRVVDFDMPSPVQIKATVAGGRTSFRTTLDAGSTTYFILAR